MTNTEKMLRDYIDDITFDCNVEITEEQKKEIVDKCFNDDYLFDTIYAQVLDAIEFVVGDLNP